ncbi:MAG: universal stress protein [Cellvibrionaceae bacterium]
MKKIIAVWDHSNTSSKLLKKANTIAQDLGANVILAVFVTSLNQKKYEAKHNATLIKKIEDQVAENFDSSVNVKHIIAVDQDIAKWVNGFCEKTKVDLILKTGNRSETLFHTPVDWQLIRQVSSPVLIASAKQWKKKPKILATIDVDNTSNKQKTINTKVLSAAKFVADMTGSHLHVIYNIAITKALTELDIVEPSEIISKKGKEAKKLLDSCLEKNKIEDATTHVVAGDVAVTVPRIAKKIKADLVVMGSVGRTGMKGMLLGNTAEKVLHNLRTDILVIKP